jgi:cysteine-rich repeat protein
MRGERGERIRKEKGDFSNDLLAICADGKIVGKEACDDGNTINGDGCSAYCDFVEAAYVCGDSGKACCKGMRREEEGTRKKGTEEEGGGRREEEGGKPVMMETA